MNIAGKKKTIKSFPPLKFIKTESKTISIPKNIKNIIMDFFIFSNVNSFQIHFNNNLSLIQILLISIKTSVGTLKAKMFYGVKFDVLSSNRGAIYHNKSISDTFFKTNKINSQAKIPTDRRKVIQLSEKLYCRLVNIIAISVSFCLKYWSIKLKNIGQFCWQIWVKIVCKITVSYRLYNRSFIAYFILLIFQTQKLHIQLSCNPALPYRRLRQ